MDKEKQSILMVGGGGREHALLWKLGQSPHVGKMYCAPGNAGTAQLAENLPIAADDIDKLLAVAKDKNIDLTVVGPEAPLAKGIVNNFNEEGKTIFGPTQEAARIESSKIWGAELMKKYGIPCFDSIIPNDIDHARYLAATLSYDKHVIKEDGLAAGKGVYLPNSSEEIIEVVNKLIDQEKKFLFQERGSGPEISIMAVTNGNNYKLFPPVKDYKRLLGGDKGPNTGGMGACAIYPRLSTDSCDLTIIRSDIIKRTIDAMENEGVTFRGTLYPGLMLTEQGPKVLEFNARFGDPETQTLMMLMTNDLLPVLNAAATENLRQEYMGFRSGAAMCIVYAAEGYPENPRKGDIIDGLTAKTDPDIQIFHAGTAKNENGEFITNGGRVVGPTAFGKTLEEAKEKIDSQGIYFKGMQRRYDIGRSMIN